MGFWNAGHNLGKKLVRGATNTKVAKAAPGGKSLGKAIRNAPGMKAPTPVPTGGLGPSVGMQAKQLPALSPEPVGMEPRPTPMPMQQELPPPPAPMPQPGGDMGMGAAMGQPTVMPRQPMEEMSSGLGPQNQFAALAQRMPQMRAMGRRRF